MNGKGDSPRNCFSKRFRKNFEMIDWGGKKYSFNKGRRVKKSLNKRKRDT